MTKTDSTFEKYKFVYHDLGWRHLQTPTVFAHVYRFRPITQEGKKAFDRAKIALDSCTCEFPNKEQ